LKLLLDTNAVLDVLMDRVPFADWAVELFGKVENFRKSRLLVYSSEEMAKIRAS
jgi:hypothetical protein